MSAGRRERAAALVGTPLLSRLTRRAARWRGVVVLNYHRVGDRSGQPWDHTLWNAGAEEFDAQLEVLASDADVIGPDDLLRVAAERRPGRHVLLTFDDGYRDNYLTAYPLLARHGLTATFFPCAGFLDDARVAWWDEIAWMVRNARADRIVLEEGISAGGKAAQPLALGPEQDETIAVLVGEYKALGPAQAERLLEFVADAGGAGRCDGAAASELWMSWEMAREMRSAGMSFGGHTVTHPILAHLSPALQAGEISGCAMRLQAELGEPMRWFAYPVGARESFTADTRRLLADAGVELAFSFYGGFGRFADWDPYDVPRVHVSAAHGPELLRATMMLPQLFARW
ncbi:MAG TPA: polysaccharide deacetylase family protein [Solirubrobacteraceae bacterium]|nr:polysaccharide deacetylase family protein [Solirubrobacteraceae bacterium]